MLGWAEEERVNYVLRRFYSDRATDAQIAFELSEQTGIRISRDMVKSARYRRDPVRAAERQHSSAEQAFLRDEQIIKAVQNGEAREAISERYNVSESRVSQIAPASIRRLDFRRHPMDRRPLDYALEGELLSAGFFLAEMTADQCRFPIGKDAETGSFRFCGETIEGRGPYCHEHGCIAHQPKTTLSPGEASYESLLRSLEKRGWI